MMLFWQLFRQRRVEHSERVHLGMWYIEVQAIVDLVVVVVLPGSEISVKRISREIRAVWCERARRDWVSGLAERRYQKLVGLAIVRN